MERKIVFLDIDGTLTPPLMPPSPLTREAVKAAREKGHKVFICTGRNMPIIGKEILDVGFDGVVASAGSHIEAEGKVLFDSLMEEETVQECLEVFHGHGIYCRIETPEGIYMDSQMEALLKGADGCEENSELIRMQRELSGSINIRPFGEYPGKGAYKICFTCTDLGSLERTKPYLADRFNYVVHPFTHNTFVYNGEIIRKGMDKGEGMEMVCRHYGMKLSDTIAFGDSMNDYQMIRCAGVGVAMGNACQELKEIADLVCENVEEDGIYHELKRMKLI